MSFAYQTLNSNNLDQVIALDNLANHHPWGARNINDSLQENYYGKLLYLPSGLAAYIIAVKQYDLLEIMSIVTHQQYRRMGLARDLLTQMCYYARANQLFTINLEVRSSNLPAIALYQHLDFLLVGRRKNYYPCSDGTREDALLMEKTL